MTLDVHGELQVRRGLDEACANRPEGLARDVCGETPSGEKHNVWMGIHPQRRRMTTDVVGGTGGCHGRNHGRSRGVAY
jgi:hypothetical protein